MSHPEVLGDRGRVAPADEHTGAPDQPTGTRSRRVDPALVAIVVAGGLLRFWQLGSQGLWYDEWLTGEAATSSLPDLVRHVADREGHPPTYFLLQWGWVRVVGDSETALRALSALFGAAVVALAHAITVELRQSRRAALLAAVFVAVSPMLVWFSQEARPYSLITLAASASFLLFVRLWNGGSRRDLVVWTVVAACTVAVHWFAAFLVAAEWVALAVRRPADRRRLLLATLPSVAVLALLAPLALEQHSKGALRDWISAFSLRTRLGEAGRSALVGPSAPDDRLWLAVLAVVVVAVAMLVLRAEPSARRAAALIGVVAGGAVLPPVLLDVAGVAEVVLGRYLIASLVPLIVAVAIGLAAAPRAIGLPLAGVATAVSLVVVVSVARDPDLQKPDWNAVASAAGDDAAIVVNVHRTMAQPLLRYADGRAALEGDTTVEVDEIAVVYGRSTEAPCNFLVGRACALIFLGAPLPADTAAQVELVERVELDQFVVERYRATDGPVTVSKADLVAPEQLGNAFVVAPED